jgi:hypothetical protein
MKKNSLRGEFLAGPKLMSYWLKEREKHERWDMAVQAMKRAPAKGGGQGAR